MWFCFLKNRTFELGNFKREMGKNMNIINGESKGETSWEWNGMRMWNVCVYTLFLPNYQKKKRSQFKNPQIPLPTTIKNTQCTINFFLFVCFFTPLHLLARFVPLELMQYSNKSDWAQQSINLYIQFNNKLKMTEEEKVHLIHTHQRDENNNKWMGGKRRDHDCPCNYVSSSSQHIEPSQREKTGELCRSSRRNGKTPKLSVISLTGSYFIREGELSSCISYTANMVRSMVEWCRWKRVTVKKIMMMILMMHSLSTRLILNILVGVRNMSKIIFVLNKNQYYSLF